MGLLQKAMGGRSSGGETSPGLLRKALLFKKTAEVDPTSAPVQKTDVPESETENSALSIPKAGSGFHERKIPEDVYGFAGKSLDKGLPLLLVKITFDSAGSDANFDRMLSSLRNFLSERSAVYRSDSGSITLVIALKSLDEEILLHQLNNYLRNKADDDSPEYSLSIRYVSDISMI